MGEKNQLTDPRLSQRKNFPLSRNFRNKSWNRKRKQKQTKEEKLFKFKKRPIWSNVNVVTHNVKGYGGNQSDKIDHIVSLINERDTPTIYLIQETWMSEEKGETTIDNVLFLSHGYKKNKMNLEMPMVA